MVSVTGIPVLDLAFLAIVVIVIVGFAFNKIFKIREELAIQSYLRKRKGENIAFNLILVDTFLENFNKMSSLARLLVFSGSGLGILGCFLWLASLNGFFVEPLLLGRDILSFIFPPISLLNLSCQAVLMIIGALLVVFGFVRDELLG